MTGIELIAAERRRQIEVEGWTAEHDATHTDRQLLSAAICYAHNSGQYKMAPPRMWPWAEEWWKPTGSNPVRDLVKAGALIAAEIDRLLAAQPKPTR